MKLSPFRIAAIYLVVAMLWIITSDLIVEIFVKDPNLLTTVNIAKGWFYVIITAIGLYYLIKLDEQEVSREKRKLEQKDKSLTLALESNKMATWEYFPDSDKYVTSSNHHGFFDFPQSRDLSLKDVFERIHPEDLEMFKRMVNQTLNTKQEFNIEYRVIRKDDSVHWLWTRGTVFTNGEKIEKVAGITSDITESKTLRRTLDLEREKFDTLFDRIPVLITVFDQEFKVSDVNREFERVLGWSPRGEEEKDPLKLFYPDEDTRKEAIDHMMNPGAGWKELKVMTKSEEVRYQLWSNIRLSDSTIVGIGYDITDRKKLEQKENKERQRLLDIFNNLPVFINIHDKDRKVIESNDFVYERLGYSKQIVEEGRLVEEMVRDDMSLERVSRHMKNLDRTWQDFDIYTKDGEKLKTSWMNMQLNESVNIGVGIDLTEIKKLEDQVEVSRTRLEQATSSANIGLWEWNPKTGEVTIDEIWANLVGYTLDELEPVTIETWNKLVHPDDLHRFELTVDEYFSGKTDMYEIEVRMRHKNGHWVWILDRGKNVASNDKGEPIKMIGTHVDITNLKQKEKQLRKNEHLLMETQRVANLGTYTLEIDSSMAQTSTILDQMFWLPDGESVTLELWEELLHPDFKYVASAYKQAIEDEEPFEAEYKIRNLKDRRERWIYEKATVEFDKNGVAIRMIGVMLDVTRSKEQELRIKRTLAQLKKAEEIAEIGYWEKNLSTGNVYWGDNKYVLYGEDPATGPMSRQKLFQQIHPDDRKPTYDAYIDAENNGNLDVTYRFKQEDGSYKTFREKAEVVRDDESGNRILRGVSIDISSLKFVETQLEEEQKRLRIITGLVSDVVWEWNFEYDTITWSEGMETVFGYRLKDLPEGEESWTSHIHPEDMERVVSSINKARHSQNLFWEEEYRFIDSSGNERYVLDQGYIFRGEDGKALKMVGAMVDQTESKLSEEILSSQAQLLEDISDAVIATDYNMKITSWNRAAEMMYGWSDKEAIGKQVGSLISTGENDEELFQVLLEKEEWSGEVVQYNRIDEPMNILSSVRVITDREGNFNGAVAVNKDITAIKKIQKKLEYEQRRFEYATSVVSDAIWDANPAEKTVWWSEGLETHYGHEVPKPDKGYEVWENNLHPDDREKVLENMKEAEDNGATEWKKEYRFYRGDGSIATVLDRAIILRNDEGEILRIIGAMNDITLQKEAEKELKRSEQQYRLLYEQSPLPMYIYNKDTFQLLSVNEALIETFGYTEDEFLQMSVFDLFMPEEKHKIKAEARRNLQVHKSGFDIWRQRTKTGDILYCEISGSDIYFKDKQQRLVVTVDITEQRKAEELAIKAVVEGEERERHRIANELHDGLGQYLSAANMHLSTVYSDFESLSNPTDRSFKTGLQMLEHAISETRSISHNLLPKAIQDYGLKLAVESLVNEMQSTEDIRIHLFQKYEDESLPGNIQINLFRIIQEALNNAIKHSQGTTININLVYSDGELLCTVEDNGSGFDPENVQNEGLGIQSMKTRVAAMSGNLDIDSKQKGGTLITAIVPLHS